MNAFISFFVFLTLLSCCTAAAARKRKPCINGDQDGDKCYCFDGWTGALCHRKMNCEGFERLETGSCVKCMKGWQGQDCDAISCFNGGKANYDETACECEKPYSGLFCDTAQTKDIYSYYNNFSSKVGALGLFTIIPLFVMYMTCEHCARRRQLERVGAHLSGTVLKNQQKAVDPKAVSLLLAEDEEYNSD
ncbi:unnamed protein product [Auanema sp. JU1783]|nr:unnamed protein product [Auanema sp. JU1783]